MIWLIVVSIISFYSTLYFHWLIDDIKKYNKINSLKKELDALTLQKYALNEICSRQSQSLIALAKLKRYGINEDRILELNNLLDNNGIKDMNSNSYTSIK